MRCPKCSYVSFDMVESCVKCGKNISEAAVELYGTVVAVEAPSFLGVAREEATPEALEETAGFDTEEPLDLGAEGEEEVMDFSFDDESAAEAEIEEIEMDLGEVGEAEVAAELDLGEEEVVEEPQGDEEDVIGISDLAPAEDAEEVQIESVEEELEVAAAGQGLEDLKVDGIDLDSGPGEASESGKVTPSVKTGTALDDFDFDLGDLVTSKKD
jgi:hypothetical protein